MRNDVANYNLNVRLRKKYNSISNGRYVDMGSQVFVRVQKCSVVWFILLS